MVLRITPQKNPNIELTRGSIADFVREVLGSGHPHQEGVMAALLEGTPKLAQIPEGASALAYTRHRLRLIASVATMLRDRLEEDE